MYRQYKRDSFEDREMKETGRVVAELETQFKNRTPDTDLAALLAEVKRQYNKFYDMCCAEYTPKCYINACDSLYRLERQINIEIVERNIALRTVDVGEASHADVTKEHQAILTEEHDIEVAEVGEVEIEEAEGAAPTKPKATNRPF